MNLILSCESKTNANANYYKIEILHVIFNLDQLPLVYYLGNNRNKEQKSIAYNL